jgi:hypothetical protein
MVLLGKQRELAGLLLISIMISSLALTNVCQSTSTLDGGKHPEDDMCAPQPEASSRANINRLWFDVAFASKPVCRALDRHTRH